MQPVNKKLLYAFILLFILTISEIIYYFFFLSPTQSKQAATNREPVVSARGSAANQYPVISKSMLDFLTQIDARMLTESTLSNIYDGTIFKLDTVDHGSKSEKTYRIFIKKDNVDTGKIAFVLSETDLKESILTDEQGETITWNDLKINDSVRIKETINLLVKDGETEKKSYEISKK